MPNPGLTEEQLKEAWDAFNFCSGSVSRAAEKIGVNRSTMRNRVLQAQNMFGMETCSEGIEFPTLPDETSSIEEIIQRRKQEFEQRQKAEEARKLIPIKVNIDGPIGILHFGDPHIDDPGTDIAALERHAKIVRETPGLYAGNVGDNQNNWVGRLANLWSNQTTTAEESRLLCEWWIHLVRDWLYIIGGNHDAWLGKHDPVRWIAAQIGTIQAESQVRFELQFPQGKPVRVNARHDFAGTSQYNAAHGPMKAALMGFKDHILTCGHKHKSGYGVVKCPSSGVISHAIIVASYKIYDDFAKTKGFPDQHISPCVLTIINPTAKTEKGLVLVCFDTETGVDYLKFLRKKERLQ